MSEATRYRIKPTFRSSRELGDCELCDKHADSVYMRVTEEYVPEVPEHDLAGFWARRETAFGHKDCLA